jgi:hypothetical protein
VDVDAVGGGGGESLNYEVILPLGGVANFTLVDTATQNRILNSKMPSTGPFTWTRDWPILGDPLLPSTDHNLVVSFAQAQKYTYKVTLVRPNGANVTVLDLDYDSTVPSDTFLQSLSVSVI